MSSGAKGVTATRQRRDEALTDEEVLLMDEPELGSTPGEEAVKVAELTMKN